MRELFVYYRVQSTDAAELRAAVDRMQSALKRRHPGLRARLLRRTETDGGASAGGASAAQARMQTKAETRAETWMETYNVDPIDPAANPSMGIDAGIEADIAAEAKALLALIEGSRHTEVFQTFPA